MGRRGHDQSAELPRQAARPQPLLVLATNRDNELAYDHPLQLVLGDLTAQRETRHMGLSPLAQEATEALVGDRGIDIAELHRITGETRSTFARCSTRSGRPSR